MILAPVFPHGNPLCQGLLVWSGVVATVPVLAGVQYCSLTAKWTLELLSTTADEADLAPGMNGFLT